MSTINQIIDAGTGGDFTTASQDGPRRNLFPIDGVNTVVAFEEDYVISLASFSPLSLDTEHPVTAGYYLVKESTPQSVGVGDVVKWTRTYAQAPATRSEYTSTVYRFIGYAGYIASTLGTFTANVPGRKPFTRTVNCRIQYDYFFTATDQTYTSPSQIPTIQQQLYYFRIGTISGSISSPVWTETYTLGTPNDIAQGSPTDYITDTSGSYALSNSIVPCVPSRSTYMGWVSAGTEIVAEPSTLSRWMGNIWVRQTKYVVAQ